MNTNKKDVNDYFKYLRLYYLELAKKRKKELEEKKKKQEEIEIKRKKQEEEFEILKKQLVENIENNINKKKVVSKSDLNKNEIKENTKVNSLENIINPNLSKKLASNKENNNKKKEQTNKELNIKKEIELKQKLKDEKKNQDELKQKQETENKKQDELKQKLENEKKKQDELKQKKELEQKKQDELKQKQETEKKNQDELKQKPKGNEKKDIKGAENKKEQDKTNVEDKNNEKDKQNKEEKPKEKNKDEKKEPRKDIKGANEKEQKNEDNKKEIKDEKKKNNSKNEENKEEKLDQKKQEEENIKLGKTEFIKCVNDKIKKDYESLRELDLEVHRINSLLNEVQDIKDINKLIDRLNKNQKSIIEILNRINMVKDGTIIGVAYSLSKTKPKELKDFIKLLEKEPNNSKYLSELFPEFKYKLDYTDTINNIKKKTDIQEKELQDKKRSLETLEIKKEDNNKNLDLFSNKMNTFKDKLLRFQISIATLENSVKSIKPIEKTETKYFLGNMEIKNMQQLKLMALNLSKDPNNALPVEQIYMNLRSRLQVITNKSIVPSNDFKNNLLLEKNNLNLTKKDISTTLLEIKSFKEEFENEYNDQLSSKEFYEYYSEIESLEAKLTNQKNKADLLDAKIDKSILENDKKIREIEKLNIEKKQQEMKEQQMSQQNPQNMKQQQTNQSHTQSINHPQQNNINYYNQYYYGQMTQEPEQERRRGR